MVGGLWLPPVWLQGAAPPASTTAATCPQPRCHPKLPHPRPWHRPPGTPSSPPGTASGHRPSVNLYFSWCLGHHGGHQPSPPQKQHLGAPWQHPWPCTVLGSPGTPRAGGSYTGPPWQHSGHGEPPTCPWRLPRHLRGSWHNQDPAEGTGCQQGPQSRDPGVGTPTLGTQHTWQPDPTEPQPGGPCAQPLRVPVCPSRVPAASVLGATTSPSPEGFRLPPPGLSMSRSRGPRSPPSPPTGARPGYVIVSSSSSSSSSAHPPSGISRSCEARAAEPGGHRAVRTSRTPPPRLQAQPRGVGGVSSAPRPPGTPHGPVLTCGHEGVFGCPRGLRAGPLRLLLLLLVELGGRGVRE